MLPLSHSFLSPACGFLDGKTRRASTQALALRGYRGEEDHGAAAGRDEEHHRVA